MKRSITRWTMALATAGVLSLPVSSFARTTQDPQPQPQPQPQQQQPPAQPQQQPQPEPQPTPAPQQQPTPTPQPSAAAAQPQAEQALTPQDYLKKAQEAAKDISASSLPAKNKTALDEMKRHLANLDKVGSSSATPSPAETAKKGSDDSKINWGTEVAAIDKIIGEMVGSESSTPTAPATPTPTGTSGKSAAIDDATRAKLMEVRAHITAYAAGMAGASTPKTEAAAPKAEAATPKAEAATPETPAARPESSSQGSTASPAAQNPPAQSPSPSPAQPDPNAAAPAQPPAQQPTPAAQAPAAQAQPQVDTDAAHKHLVTARETLAQLTQLPAAAQLAGEARNQVSQLITNFNELITSQSNWKASYDKVNANLTALIGSDNAGAEANAGAPTANAGATPAPNAPPSATPGAVGTAGTTTVELDPAIRAKLVELRKSLNEFRKAAGGGQ